MTLHHCGIVSIANYKIVTKPFFKQRLKSAKYGAGLFILFHNKIVNIFILQYVAPTYRLKTDTVPQCR